MDGWIAERSFTLQKLTLEWEARCRHNCCSLYIGKGIRALNAGLEKPKEGESGRASQRRHPLSWGLKTEKKGRVFKQKAQQGYMRPGSQDKNDPEE